MATEQLHLCRLHCDGECGAYIDGFSAKDARERAAAADWKFPAKEGVSGRPSKRTNDVCPACFPAWTPQRPRSEWDGVGPEERRLRTLLRTSWTVLSRDERARIEARVAALANGRSSSGD